MLSKSLNLAELWGYRPDHSNPCRHIKKYAENKRERFLTAQEISNLLKVIDDDDEIGKELPSVIHAIRLLILTGCRLNEILTLKWNEVDFPNQCLHLSDSKTSKKTIYLSPIVFNIFSSITRI